MLTSLACFGTNYELIRSSATAQYYVNFIRAIKEVRCQLRHVIEIVKYPAITEGAGGKNHTVRNSEIEVRRKSSIARDRLLWRLLACSFDQPSMITDPKLDYI